MGLMLVFSCRGLHATRVFWEEVRADGSRLGLQELNYVGTGELGLVKEAGRWVIGL